MTILDHISFHKKVPSQGKLLAIDIGTKRIGIAMSDVTRLLVTPTKILNRKSNFEDFTEIKRLIDENHIVAIVAGLPINMDGSANEMSEFSNKFVEELDDFLGQKMQIFLADERLTSFEAKQIGLTIKSRKYDKHFDDIAAAIILEDFLGIVR